MFRRVVSLFILLLARLALLAFLLPFLLLPLLVLRWLAQGRLCWTPFLLQRVKTWLFLPIKHLLLRVGYELIYWIDRDKPWSMANTGYGAFPAKSTEVQWEQQQGELHRVVVTQGGKLPVPESVLDVGCGRGGGLQFLMGSSSLKSAMGVDVSEAAIQFCERHNKFTGRIAYMASSAQQLTSNISYRPSFVLAIQVWKELYDPLAFLRGALEIMVLRGTLCVVDWFTASQKEQLLMLVSHTHLVLPSPENQRGARPKLERGGGRGQGLPDCQLRARSATETGQPVLGSLPFQVTRIKKAFPHIPLFALSNQ